MFTFKVDVDQLVARLDARYHNQLPFAVSRGINQTLRDVQGAIQKRIAQRGFTLRTAVTSAWVQRQVMIAPGDMATKEKLSGAVSIGRGSSSSQRATLLPFLEGGGVRTSRAGIGSAFLFAAGSVAIPIRANPMEVIPRNLYPTALGLQEYRSVEGGMVKAGRSKRSRRRAPSAYQLKGSARTFIVRTKAGEGLILQRQGRGGGGGRGHVTGRALFTIKPQAHVTGRDFFYSTGIRQGRAVVQYNMQTAMADALRTARPLPV